MVEYHETLITSLVTRPGSASTLAIIEQIWSGFFGLIFGFVGFSSMFVQGFISASRHPYRFELKRYVVKRSHICVLLWTLQTHPFRKNLNWKAKKGKRKEKTTKRKQKVDAVRSRTLSSYFRTRKELVHLSCWGRIACKSWWSFVLKFIWRTFNAWTYSINFLPSAFQFPSVQNMFLPSPSFVATLACVKRQNWYPARIFIVGDFWLIWTWK